MHILSFTKLLTRLEVTSQSKSKVNLVLKSAGNVKQCSKFEKAPKKSPAQSEQAQRPLNAVFFLGFQHALSTQKTCITAFYLLNIPAIYLPSNLLHGNLFHKCISLVQRRFHDLNSFLQRRRLLCRGKSRLKHEIHIKNKQHRLIAGRGYMSQGQIRLSPGLNQVIDYGKQLVEHSLRLSKLGLCEPNLSLIKISYTHDLLPFWPCIYSKGREFKSFTQILVHARPCVDPISNTRVDL